MYLMNLTTTTSQTFWLSHSINQKKDAILAFVFIDRLDTSLSNITLTNLSRKYDNVIVTAQIWQ